MTKHWLCPLLQGLTFVCAALFAGAVGAQDFPSRSITVIMPIAPGSAPDNQLRIVAAEVAKSVGQAVVVENRPGGGGRLGLNAVREAPKDGYVIGVGYLGPLVVLASDPKFTLEPVKDYTPILLMSEAPLVLVASTSAPFRDLGGLLAHAKANPGKMSVSGVSYGSGAHIAFEMLKLHAGIDVVIINYKGEADQIPALIRGEVLAGMGSGTLKASIDAGKLHGLATTGGKRWNVFPSLPTFQEAGLKDYEISGWYGLVGPAGLPSGVVAKLHGIFGAALANAEVRKKISDTGLTPLGSTPDEFAKRVQSDLGRIGTVIRTAGIKLQ